MKKTITLLLALFLIISITAGNDAQEKVEPAVLQALEEQGEVSVIVLLKNEPLREERMPTILSAGAREDAQRQVQDEVLESLVLKGEETQPNSGKDRAIQAAEQEYDLELVRQYSLVNGFSGTVTQEGLEKLQDNPLVEKIYYNTILHPTLDVSVPLINANDVWNLSVGGYNISGRLETVCMLDTGIDTDHPAFQDKILDQHCFCNVNSVACCAGSKTEALTAEDDQGHGTHTAGTAAGNHSTYTGVARDARIVAIKVCNNASSAACASADVLSAIDWCANNATTYNISVISMSLGGGGPYNSYCNDDSLAAPINNAVGKNISVVVSAGNDGFTTGISSPACVQNATPVGAVDDSDGILYNRGAILDLLAPGSGIIAPYRGGGTTSLSGTSMSAPHVAGAIALFRQYYRLAYSRMPTPDEIKIKLRLTGKLIDDSSNSGRNYSRIDILVALQPFINYTITNPTNNSATNAVSAVINITSDVNLTNALLEWSYNNGTRMNLSMNKVNGTHFNLNVSRLADGVETYFVYGNDTVGTIGTSITRTITIDTVVPAVIITNPANGTNLSSGTQAFNATINEQNIDAVRFSFSNVTGVAFNVTPTNVSGNWNTNLDLTRLSEGRQTMTVVANDTGGNYNRSQFIDFVVDRTAPNITVLSPLPDRNFTRTADNQTFNITVREALLTVGMVLFNFDNASGTNFNVTAINQSGNWIASYNVSSLTEGAQIVTIIANDTVGNYNRTVNITFTIDFTAPTITANSPAADRNFTFLSSNQTFNVTIRDNLLSLYGVLFSFDNSTGTGFNLSAANQSGYWIISYNVSVLGNGSHVLAIFANDTAGNLNNTQNITFTIDIFSPIVTLNRPIDRGNSSSSSVTFNCTSQDNRELFNVTLYGNWTGSWHANETTKINGTTNESTFSKTLADGNYRWNCLTADADGYIAFAPANFTMTVDTTLPFISSISSGTPTATAATITWTTNENANSSLNYGTALSLGTISSSLSLKTSHSQSLSSLSASTVYFYNISSCDLTGNCNVTGAYNFTTTAAAAADGGTGGGAGGGAGGGGGGSAGGALSSQTAAETPKEEKPAETPAETGAAVPPEIPLVAPVAEPVIFSQPISVVKGEENRIALRQEGIPVRQITIDSKTSKDTVLTFTTFTGKPAEISEVEGAYQYFEMKVDLSDDDVKRAIVTFVVPESWLKENNFVEQTVKLNTLEGKKWNELPTKLVAKGENELIYEAKLKHFSYFAISAKSELELAWFRNLIPPQVGSRELVLFGLILLIAVLAFAYYLVREKD